jgi:hypothetical protein
MKTLELEQMEHIEGGDVEPPFCGSSVGARILQVHPVVGGFCIGIAIGNWIYRD